MAKKTIKKQGFMNGVLLLIVSQIAIKIVGLVYKVYLTNREGFGDAGNAIYGSGYQIYSLLLLLSSIGIPSAIAKLVAEKVALGDYKGAHRVFKISFAIVSMAGAIGSLILFFGAKYIANNLLMMPEATLTIMCLSPSVFFVSMSSVIRGYFTGRTSMQSMANSQSLEQVFKTVLTVVLVELVAAAYSNNTVFMAAAANLATTFSVILSFIYIFMYYKNRREGVWKEIREQKEYVPERKKTIIKRILAVAIPISLTSIIVSINKTIDSFTVVRGLSNFLTPEMAKEQFGILTGKVDTLVGLPLAFNGAFSTVLIPSISGAQAQNDKKSINEKIYLSLLITLLLALPASLGMCIFAEPIINLVFPNANAGANILSAISFLVLFTMIGQTLNGALQGLGKLKTPVVALVIGVTVKTILNLILIPIEKIGIYGATSSSILCYFIVFVIEMIVLMRAIKLKIKISQFVIKPIIATGVMGATSYLLFRCLAGIIGSNLSVIIAIIFAVIIYAILIILLRILDKEELLMIPAGEKIYKICHEKLKIM